MTLSRNLAQRTVQRTLARVSTNPYGLAESFDYSDYLYIQTKQDELIKFVPNRVQAHFLAHRTGRDLVLKARQHGISTVIQADHFTTAVTRRVRCATLAHDDVGTQLLRRMSDRFWASLPDNLRPVRGLDNATTTTYPSTGSEVLIATAGSKNKGRAGTYTRVHGSEVAFWSDASAVMAGLMQGVPQEGEIVLESTPNGAQGWFWEQCTAAMDGDGKWTLHFYPWWWSDDYQMPLENGETLDPYSPEELELIAAYNLTPEQIKWRRDKQKELGRLFLQEYPEDPHSCFLASGLGYFSDIDHLERVFTAPTDSKPNPGHRYIAAADFGQAQDYSAMSVMDANTRQEVELWRANRIPWGDIRTRMRLTCQKWNVQEFAPEGNSMGTTNIEELEREFRAAGLNTSIRPFFTTPQTKPIMVTGFHWALDEGGLRLLPDPIGKQEINAYTAKQTPNGHWQYEGLPHDDTVIARIGCWNAMVGGARMFVGETPADFSDYRG